MGNLKLYKLLFIYSNFSHIWILKFRNVHKLILDLLHQASSFLEFVKGSYKDYLNNLSINY